MTQTDLKNPIHAASPRDNVRVTFKDELVLEGPMNTTIEAFLQQAQARQPERFDSLIMGGILDGRLRELAYTVQRDAALDPVLLSSSDGGRIYRRSLVMLLTTAIDELWPDVKVSVGYSIPEGGFYCRLVNREPFTAAELERLDAHMREMIAADLPIVKQLVPLEEATAIFAARDADDKLRLLEQRQRNVLTLYTLRGRSDYFYGYMTPSTRYLTIFKLTQTSDGFILQYPRKEHPNVLDVIAPETKVGRVFAEAENWLARLGIEDIGRLNRFARVDKMQELVLVAEALHEQRIAAIAAEIAARHETSGARLVLISGPSSSGKTTFSKRLSIQLLAYGLRPYTIEMDNYFVDRNLTPRDEAGAFDFDALGAVNLPLFNTHLTQLINGEEIQLPRFDFRLGKSVAGLMAKLSSNQVVVIEGIHGLNPALVPEIPRETVYRIYVSALTSLNMDLHNRIPTTDVRLLRRIVRDAATRGFSATETLSRWSSVRRGEKRNIFPFQENADVMFNSSLVYELAALRTLAEPLLLQVEPGTPPHIEANRLLSFLRWVQPMSVLQQELIPDTSLLREFIGGSILEDYHPGDLTESETREDKVAATT